LDIKVVSFFGEITFQINFLFELEANINIEGESINKLDQVTQLGKKLITNWKNKV
jgi:hypothetical protein